MSKTKKNKKLKITEPNFAREEQEIIQSNNVYSRKRKKLGFKKTFKIIKKSIAYGKPYHGYLYLAILSIFIQTIAELIAPIYMGKAINNIIGVNNVNWSGVASNICIMLVFVLVNSLFSWIMNVSTNRYTFKSSEYIREQFFKKLNTVPLKFIDTNAHGDLLSRMVNDIDALTDGILEGLSGITNGVVSIIGTLIAMFAQNVPLATVVTIITPFSMVVSIYIAQKSYKLFGQEIKSEGELSGYLEELLSGGRVVIANNHKEDALANFDKINSRYYNAGQKAEFYSNLANPSTRFINSISYGLVGLVGCLIKLNNPAFKVGTISTFLSYANTFGKPFNELSSEITELQAAFVSAERIFAVLDAKDEPSDALLPELASATGSIEVKNAYFSYVPKVQLIQNFNLSVKPGEKVAIVGPTGCGKTTFINLLMRFYDLTDGSIELDGTPITSIKRNSLRNKYGMVLQETWMFNGTVRENIAYGKPNATDEEIKEAACLAGVDDFIQTLPHGYNTLISEGGANISQGQKQLICIARIMLLKPVMLILDEATSNIDTRTELKIQSAFDAIMKGRTTFIVAHRLSTIQSADIILVMNKGNIIEQGTHKELLAKRGFYYNLYNSQF